LHFIASSTFVKLRNELNFQALENEGTNLFFIGTISKNKMIRDFLENEIPKDVFSVDFEKKSISIGDCILNDNGLGFVFSYKKK